MNTSKLLEIQRSIYKREMKKTERNFYVMSCIALAALCLAFIALYGGNDRISNIYPQDRQLEVTYHELTRSQIDQARSWMSGLDAKYLRGQKEIHIGKNIEKVSKGLCNDDCLAVNVNYGAIYVPYLEDEQEFKTVLCHELLHTYMLPPVDDDPEELMHSIVYDLASKHVCYQNSGSDVRISWEPLEAGTAQGGDNEHN